MVIAMRVEDRHTAQPPQKRRMLFRVGVGICSLAPAMFVTLLIGRLSSPLKGGALFLIFVGAYLASYSVWNWVFFERPAELNKKMPISSKELRRRTKEFYDNLPH
jgi:hypothetical protein